MRTKLQTVIFLGSLVGAALVPSMASAESYHINLAYAAVVQGSELQAGNHKMNLTDGRLTIQSGKQELEVPVSVEQAGQTFRATSVVYRQERGKYSIAEVQLGGTKTKLVFNTSTSAGLGR